MIILKMFRLTVSCGLSALCLSHDAIEAMGDVYSGALLQQVTTLLRAGQDALAPATSDSLVWLNELLLLVLS